MSFGILRLFLQHYQVNVVERAYAAFTSSQDSKQGVIIADEMEGKLRLGTISPLTCTA